MLWKYLLWITFCKLFILHPFVTKNWFPGTFWGRNFGQKIIGFLNIRIIELDGKNLDRFPVGDILQHALFTKNSNHVHYIKLFWKYLWKFYISVRLNLSVSDKTFFFFFVAGWCHYSIFRFHFYFNVSISSNISNKTISQR